jgi:hypothetical protein
MPYTPPPHNLEQVLYTASDSKIFFSNTQIKYIEYVAVRRVPFHSHLCSRKASCSEVNTKFCPNTEVKS